MALYHPQVVHFAVALLVVGVLLRVVSLLGKPAFVGPAGLLLLVLGTGAAALAVYTGLEAHGPVERVPGVREAVGEHEEWGIRTRNAFFGVLAIELVALLMRRSPKARMVRGVAAVAGLVGLAVLYQAGDHGGRLVYSYAGGVGIRSGDPADVERLLLAGLYQQAQVERQNGRLPEAAALLDQAARRSPNQVAVQLTWAESQLIDRHDPEGALATLNRIAVPSDDRFLRLRQANLRADALEAAGQKEAAIAVLDPLLAEFPTNARLKQRIEALKKAGAAPPR